MISAEWVKPFLERGSLFIKFLVFQKGDESFAETARTRHKIHVKQVVTLHTGNIATSTFVSLNKRLKQRETTKPKWIKLRLVFQFAVHIHRGAHSKNERN